eukprot:TRINITY_DN72983_c0_g1_i1.p1 TRINITY_DN72983_c0_g1~~TRINITY_DN72983_c0_g1_i1.p1  ORF type:complete len:319 (+),score=22.35 TRINITY_DN72983_c0_g1_i1:65-958(+)
MACQPASECCCVFPVRVGGAAIVLLHLVINLLFFTRSFGRIFFPETFPAMADDHVELVTAAFFFAGLPLVMLGMWAILTKDEILLRTYWFYMILCSVIAAVILFQVLLVANCATVSGVLKDSGSGAFCGMYSAASMVLLCIVLANLLYSIFVIWSLCTHFWYNSDRLKDWIEAPAAHNYSTLTSKGLHGAPLSAADQPCCNALCSAYGCGFCCSPGTPCGECSSCFCAPGAPCGTACGDLGVANLAHGGRGGAGCNPCDPCSLCCGGDPTCGCCQDCFGGGRSYEAVDYAPKQHHLV